VVGVRRPRRPPSNADGGLYAVRTPSGQPADTRTLPSVAVPDIDWLNGRWFCAIRDGIVIRCADDPDTWCLTEYGCAIAHSVALAHGLDLDTLSASQLISIAAYGTPALGDPVA
jgi:hypothetical protein